MGTDSNEMFHISTARSALPIINISHDAGLNLSAEFSRRIILNKSFSQKLIKRILGLNKHIGIISSHFREKFAICFYSESKSKNSLFCSLLGTILKFKKILEYRYSAVLLFKIGAGAVRLILFLGHMKLKRKRNNRIKLKLILKNRLN